MIRRIAVLACLALGTGLMVWSAVASAQDRGGQPPAPARPGDPTRRDMSSYRLRVEDEIEITIHKPNSFDSDLSRRIVVPANGEVSFSPIGRINLKDRTADELEDLISLRLREGNYLLQPNVGVLVTKYAPRRVAIIGAVRSSVELPVHQDLRILDLLSRVGGLDAPDADFTRVEIRRVGPDGRIFKFRVDVDAVFEGTDEQQNVVVREGDIVRVPRLEFATPQSSEFVYVLGRVSQRGRIPMIRGRKPFMLTHLIALCGDFAEFADRSEVKVIRYTETGRREEVIDFDDIIEGKRADFRLEPDDLIYVPERLL